MKTISLTRLWTLGLIAFVLASVSKGNNDFTCNFKTDLCSWEVERGSAHFVKKSTTPTRAYNDVNVFIDKLKKDQALILRNDGQGIKITNTLSKPFEENVDFPQHIVIYLYSYSGEDKSIEIRGRFKDGSTPLLWADRTSPNTMTTRIELSPKLQGLIELSLESDVHQLVLDSFRLHHTTNYLYPECAFAEENICKLQTDASVGDILFYRRSRFGSPLGQASIEALKKGLKAPLVDQKEEEKIQTEEEENLIDFDSDNLEVPANNQLNEFENANELRILEPVSYIKVSPDRTIYIKSGQWASSQTFGPVTILIAFMFRKRLESQAPIYLQVQINKAEKIDVWNSYEEPPNEDYPWRRVTRKIVRSNVRTTEMTFLMHGDQDNALANLAFIFIPKEIKEIEFGCSFHGSFCSYDLIQPNVGSGFRVGPWLLQSPQSISLKSKLENEMFAYADFTGPSQPVKTGQLAWDDKLSATEMAILTPPILDTGSKEHCAQFELLILTDGQEDENSAFEFSFYLESSHATQRLAWTRSTDQKIVTLQVPIYIVGEPRIRMHASRLNPDRRGVVAVRHFYVRAGSCLNSNMERNELINDLSCYFASDLCGWKNGGDEQWKRSSWDDSTHYFYPFKTPDIKLGYVKIDSLNNEDVQKSRLVRLISPSYLFEKSHTGGIFCVHLVWYLVCGSQRPCHIRLWLNDNDETLLLINTPNLWFSWKHSKVTFTRFSEFRLMLDAHLPANSRAAVAMIELTEGACSNEDVKLDEKGELIRDQLTNEFFLDFEHNDGQISSTTSPPFRWLEANHLKSHAKEQLADSTEMIPVDHTTGESWGRVWALQLHSKLSRDVFSLLKLPLHTHIQQCVSFWVQINAACEISWYDRYNFLTNKRWSWKVDFPTTQWEQFRFNTQSLVDLHIITQRTLLFEAVCPKTENSGFIAIDDIHVKPGECSSEVSCSFEHDNCGWMCFRSDSFRYLDSSFKEQQVSSIDKIISLIPMHGRLPMVDHTLNSAYGHVLLIPSGISILESGKIASEFISCFSFYYHKGVADPMTVSVFAGTGDNRLILQVGEIKLESNDRWAHAALTLSINQMMWSKDALKEAKSINNWSDEKMDYKTRQAWNGYHNLYLMFNVEKSELLIDDIDMQRGTCQSNELFFCDVGRTKSILKEKVCDQVIDCVDGGADEAECGSCDFNSDHKCGYEDAAEAFEKFSIQVGPNSHQPAGQIELPKDKPVLVAHTKKRVQKGQFIAIRSPLIQRTYKSCTLAFTYALDRAYLKIALKIKEDNIYHNIWINKNDQFTPERIRIPLRSYASPFIIEFRTKSFKEDGHAMLADIQLENCAPFSNSQKSDETAESDQTLLQVKKNEIIEMIRNPLSPTPSNSKFICLKNKNQISITDLCNGEDDCDDGTDELFSTCYGQVLFMNFEKKLEDVRKIKGFVVHFPSPSELVLPAIDHSRTNTMVYAMMISKAHSLFPVYISSKKEEGSKRKKVTEQEQSDTQIQKGELGYWQLLNHGTCSFRFAYWKNGDRIQAGVKWIHISDTVTSGVEYVELKTELDWTLAEIPLYKLVPHGQLRIYFTASLDNFQRSILAVDDLSLSLDCTYMTKYSIGFDLKKLKPSDILWEMQSLPEQTSLSINELIEPTPNQKDNIAQYYLNVEPKYSSDEKQSTQSKSFQIRSVRIFSDSSTLTYLVVKYYFRSFGNSDVRLTDMSSNKELMRVRSHTSFAFKTACITLTHENLFSNTQLDLQVNLQTKMDHFALNHIKMDYGNCEREEFCSFDGDNYCKHISSHPPINSFELNSIHSAVLPLPDHTLGSNAGGFLFARSDHHQSFAQLLLATPNKMRVGCIKFGYTSGRIDAETGNLVFSLNKDEEFGEMIIHDFGSDPRNTFGKGQKSLFRFNANLNWEWRQASVRVPWDKHLMTYMNAKFAQQRNADGTVQVFAIDDLQIDRKSCPEIECNFQVDMCGWTNVEKYEPQTVQNNQQINWDLVYDVKHLPSEFRFVGIGQKSALVAMFQNKGEYAQLQSVTRRKGLLGEHLEITCSVSTGALIKLSVHVDNGRERRLVAEFELMDLGNKLIKEHISLPVVKDSLAQHVIVTAEAVELGGSTGSGVIVMKNIEVLRMMVVAEEEEEEEKEENKRKTGEKGKEQEEPEEVELKPINRESEFSNAGKQNSSKSPNSSNWFYFWMFMIFASVVGIVIYLNYGKHSGLDLGAYLNFRAT